MIISPEDSQQIERVIRQAFPDARKGITIQDLIRQWELFVEHIEKGYEESVYEYINDLYTRDIIEAVIAAMGERLRQEISRNTRSADCKFLQLTVPLVGSTIFRSEMSAKGWWWHRLPVKINRELEDDLRHGEW